MAAAKLFTVFHSDHGISEAQMEHIQSSLLDKPDGFFIQQIDLPEELGTVPNGMYGPVAGDAAIGEDEVIYEKRGDRPYADRMICKAPRPCSFVQAIGVRDGDSFTLYTVYGGCLAPQHPEDETNQDPDASKAFWAQHALATG